MNLRCLAAIVVTLTGFGLSVPAVAQTSSAGQAVPDDVQAVAITPTSQKSDPTSEWRLKPRWRVQYDVANIDGPDGLPGTGSLQDIRRARVGVDLTMSNGFAARLETELTADPIELTDVYLQWSDERFKVMLGQQKPQLPLDEENSNLNISFMERAAFVSAFGYSRRTGVSVHYANGDWGGSAGIYTDPLILLNDAATNSMSVDYRAYWSPQLADTTLHFGGSYHWRDLNDVALLPTQYRTRPALRISDTRYVGTPALTVEKEERFGFEIAAVQGRFHLAGEAHWLKARRERLSDPIFFGAYAEIGIFLTQDSRPLKAGLFGAIKPRKALGGGGVGAVQLNVRYDYLDLNSAAVIGGKQDAYLASLIWMPAENFRLMGQYARLKYMDAVVAVAGDRNYSVDTWAIRGQISF